MVDKTSQIIECPDCGHKFSATQAFEEHIHLEAQKIADISTSKAKKEFKQKLEEARLADAKQLDEKAAEKAAELMSSYSDELADEKKATQLSLELQKARSEIEIASETRQDEIALAVSQAVAETPINFQLISRWKSRLCWNKQLLKAALMV